MQTHMSGKICIVTGANSGIGKVAARELAKMGATVVLICRSRDKGEAAQQEIKAASGSNAVDLLLADLSSQQSIRQLVEQFKKRYTQLHVLLNNAGAMFPSRRESVDGIEMSLAVNHIAPFLFTNLLLDTLQASEPARIVNVNSGAHFSGKINFDDLQSQKKYGGLDLQAYSQSKLANLLVTYELARRLKDTSVTVNALHPGFVATNISQNAAPGPLKPFMSVVGRFMGINVEAGAKTSIYLASSPEIEGVSGKYFVKCAPVTSSKLSYDEELQKRMWEVSEELTKTAVHS
ncbi:short-chain dehydrogenase [Ktedonobacter sp. SOSP1-85]|uniref:SDR family oxidoreductase n=1 Tax=Ktedonobacter sp. SOSP1-85 TaxID=2778367 RepID=UPI001915D89B|nr:SDR family oxidoreductase [Ktedonobacter sp. SOSP1-85]GHO77888.1 short-chain dehydrogenase [Ktedonobacter sp. SOSP1-85]